MPVPWHRPRLAASDKCLMVKPRHGSRPQRTCARIVGWFLRAPVPALPAPRISQASGWDAVPPAPISSTRYLPRRELVFILFIFIIFPSPAPRSPSSASCLSLCRIPLTTRGFRRAGHECHSLQHWILPLPRAIWPATADYSRAKQSTEAPPRGLSALWRRRAVNSANPIHQLYPMRPMRNRPSPPIRCAACPS